MFLTLRQHGPLIGRIFLSALFIISGIKKIMGFEGTVGFVESADLPLPVIIVVLTILIEIVGGIALLIGFRARLAATILGAFAILAAVVFHTDFSAQGQMEQLLKNFSIAGGMLYVMIYGAGPLSVDSRGRMLAQPGEDSVL